MECGAKQAVQALPPPEFRSNGDALRSAEAALKVLRVAWGGHCSRAGAGERPAAPWNVPLQTRNYSPCVCVNQIEIIPRARVRFAAKRGHLHGMGALAPCVLGAATAESSRGGQPHFWGTDAHCALGGWQSQAACCPSPALLPCHSGSEGKKEVVPETTNIQ